MAKARKRKKDKEDEELAAWVAEIGGVVNYMNKVSSEEIEKKGELYLDQGRMIVEQSRPNVPIPEKTSTDEILIPEKPNAPAVHAPEDKEKTSTARVLNPEKPDLQVPEDKGEISTNGVLIPEKPGTPDSHTPKDAEKTSTAGALNPEELNPENQGITPAAILNNDSGITPAIVLNGISINRILNFEAGITPAAILNNKTSTAGILNPETGISTNAILNLYRVKVSFEQEHLLRFINGAYSILFCPQVEHRIKLILLAILLKATCEKSCSTKIKTNDLLRGLRMSKALQKQIPSLVEESGLAKVVVRKKGGTEVTFNEEIFNPSGKNGSIEIDRLINIYNLSIYQKNNNEEKIEEKRRIPLLETGKYVMLISLHLADFPLNAVTGSLMEAIKGKDPELVTAFWIYATASAGKIKSPSAYLIKVLKNNDTGSLSGEIMEKAKVCMKAAQTVVHETYDEPELAFLKSLAQKLSLTDAYYKDRMSLTVELKSAGRKLIDECEKILKKLPKVDS